MAEALCPGCKEVKKLTASGKLRKHYTDQPSGFNSDNKVACLGSGQLPIEPAAPCERCGREVNPIRGVIRSHTAPDGTFCCAPPKGKKMAPCPDCGKDLPDPPPSYHYSPSGFMCGEAAAGVIDVPMSEAAQEAIGPAEASWPKGMPSATQEAIDDGKITWGPSLADQDAAYQAAEDAQARREGIGPVPPSQEEFLGSKQQRAKPRKRQPLEPRAAEYATWFKELFFGYQHTRERSKQATIGPSEAGSECVRKIAMKLSGCDEVNYEHDSWPAWMGTQGHSGAEKIIEWANEQSHSQRYLIEAALELGHPTVPRGHSDLFDRLKGAAIDWKFPGKSSLSKMHLDGCPIEYRKQLHIYGYGQRLAGETVREVALIALPREGGTLEDMYVFVEDFDPDIAIAAMERVRGIHHALGNHGGDWTKAPKTPSFLCGWCPYHLPDDTSNGRKGCNGKKD